MRISQKGIDLIIEFEGLRQKAYICPAGFWTIGVGHLLTGFEKRSGMIEINGRLVDWEPGLSDAQVEALLRQDLEKFEISVREAVKVTLTQEQFDALVSFCFNVGPGNFRKSTLLRLLNRGDYTAVPGQLQLWVKAGRRALPGLIRRRAAEAKLWSGNG